MVCLSVGLSHEKKFPFGRYKGKPIEAAAEDKEYLTWLLSQSWFPEKYPDLHTIIINNFQEPVDTPEHNRLQGLFLDKNFTHNFLYEYFSASSRIRGLKYERELKHKIKEVRVNLVHFEVGGNDVIVSHSISCDPESFDALEVLRTLFIANKLAYHLYENMRHQIYLFITNDSQLT